MIVDRCIRQAVIGSFKHGQNLYITSQKNGSRVSKPTIVNLQPAQKTPVPNVVTQAVYADGGWLSGFWAPGSTLFLKNTNEEIIYSTSYSYNNNFSFDIPKDKLAGSKLFLTVKEEGKYVSDPVDILVKPIEGSTSAPKVTGTVSKDGGWVFIQTEPYAKLYLKRADDSIMIEKRADGEGLYSTYISTYELKQTNKVFITADAYGKTESTEPTVLNIAP
ncbi:hypothetical protein [Paenibacillus sp. N3.4]|uniref:hypothetical protein n=1 Tax=Paenibacillus sp. N3.4 TaxID=2603222 RepID=UPI0011C80991|nr:hypothetical protein [Paenibacillus sp. N3.4]TXK85910.1 hypothetical protein FU659_00090 [Paenibacillus sp. N3.4]